MTAQSFAEQLAARTGLAQIIAAGVIRRACTRIGVDPESLTREDLPRLVDAMEPLLVVYLGPADAPQRANELRRFAKTL